MKAAEIVSPAGPAQPQAVFWLGALYSVARSEEYIRDMRLRGKARSGARYTALRDASIALASEARKNAKHVRDTGALLHVNAPRLSFVEREDFDYDVVVRPAGVA